MFGLLNSDIEFIINTVNKFECIKKIGIYGSRARGDYLDTSDIDIVLYGSIDLYTLSEVTDILENKSPYPYFVDVTSYDLIKDGLFKQEVDKDVRIIYEDKL